MTPITRRRISLWVSIVIFCGVVSILYSLMLSKIVPFEWSIKHGMIAFRTGILISGVSAALEVFYFPNRAGVWLRRMPFILSLFLHLLIQFLVIFTGLLVTRELSAFMWGPDPIDLWGGGAFIRDMVFGSILLGVSFIFLQMRSLIGGRTLRNFLLGRYNKPKKENCIFMFIDVVGSTKIARELGDKEFHEFLSRFFFEIDDIIINHGGEVHSYVGDAVIVTWGMKTRQANARAVEAVFAIDTRIKEQGAEFEIQFGVAPKFHAALHGGPVVAGECGDSHRQITYLGDVVNVTARIEGVTKVLNRQVIISEVLLEQMDLPDTVQVEKLGHHDLKGVDGEIGLVSLTLRSE